MNNSSLEKKDKPRVRYAPSPTGPFHIGGLRTVLFNYLFAKQRQGSFILRIEDTDLERSDPKWEKDIVENLCWAGLLWDEGPAFDTKGLDNVKYVGGYGPYRQSERKTIYEKYIRKLFDSGFLYWCYCTKEELEAQKQDQIARGEAPRYVGRCRNLGEKDIKKFKEKRRKGILRFKVPVKKIKVKDLIRGDLEFDTELLGDIAVARDFSTPLYNLAVVIDDFEMKINYVIRGEDHLSNTPKQILFQEALGFPRPAYAHLPLILGQDRSKLSKRHSVVRVKDYKEDGYLPEAMINFLALLGWNLGTNQEIFSKEELIKKFSLQRVQKGGAIFNIEKLDFLNGYYIRKASLNEITKKCIPYLVKNQILKIENQEITIQKTGAVIDFKYLSKIVSLFKERLKKLSEITEFSNFFFQDKLSFDTELLVWKDMKKEGIQKNLKKCYKALNEIEDTKWQKEDIKEVLTKEAEKEIDRGRILWPLRVALSGKKASPSPFEIAEVLGKEKTLKRIEETIERLNDSKIQEFKN